MTTTSKPIDAALAAIPGWADALTVKRTLDSWGPPTISEDDLAGVVWDAARRGEPTPPADLAERLARQVLARQGLNEAWSLIRTARQQAAAALDETVRVNPDPALTYLGDRLAEVLAAVRQADAALPAAVSAETAARAGGKVLTAWQQLTAAADDYDEIRTVQWQVMSATTRPEGVGDRHQHRAWFLRSGLLADAIDRDQWWIDRRADAAGARLVRSIEGVEAWYLGDHAHLPVTDPDPALADWLTQPARVDLRTPGDFGEASDRRAGWLLACRPLAWRSTADAGSWWPTDDRAQYLRWITAHARPWVPTHAQLVAADVAALSATAAATGGRGTVLSADQLTAANTALGAYRRVGDARRTT